MDPATLEHLRTALMLYIILLLSIALHEYGHAKAADLLGDPLPREQGRVTLNPVAHWDLLGTIILPAIMIIGPVFYAMPMLLIGWGKPVIISLPNPKTRVRDDILVTLAGPAMNLLIAAAAAVAGGLYLRAIDAAHAAELTAQQERVTGFVENTLYLNIALIAFNMVPLPPLDGSHLLRHAVRMKDETYLWLSRNSLWILLLLINIPVGGMSLFSWMALPFRLIFGVPLIRLLNVIAGG